MSSEKSLYSTVLDTASGATQSFAPFSKICEHVCGLHFYAHDMTRQVEAHHYCSHVSDDFRQCVIYDGPGANARLIGVEYIVSEKIFKTLDAEEKKYWHSHTYEVKSGTLIAPFPALVPKAVADAAELKAVEVLVGTYGKTWHLWQVDRNDSLPLGAPSLMMGLTRDGQVDPALLKKRDEVAGVSSDEKRKQREGIEEPQVVEGANSWESGRSWQCVMEPCQVDGLKL